MPRQLTRPMPAELRAIYAELGTGAAVGLLEEIGPIGPIGPMVSDYATSSGADDDLWDEEPQREPAPLPAPVRKRAQPRPAKRGANVVAAGDMGPIGPIGPMSPATSPPPPVTAAQAALLLRRASDSAHGERARAAALRLVAYARRRAFLGHREEVR